MEIRKPRRKINKVFLHCTAYPHQDLLGDTLVEAITRWHLARGWNTIGYHGVIDCRGLYIPGRDFEKTPAAQGGHNTGTLAFSLDGLYINQFNQKQFTTLCYLADQLDDFYGDSITYHGHCEVNSGKTCPVFDYKKVLGLDANGNRRHNASSIDLPAEDTLYILPEHNVEEKRTLSKTSRGDDVQFVQSFLGIDADGIFGSETYKAVVKFQTKHNLLPDGIVGPNTWQSLLKLKE